MARKSAKQDGFVIAEGLDGIRLNPSMYLGARGSHMVHRCIKEAFDNSYDEHVAGRNDTIEVVMDLDRNLYVVADKAGGIPTDYKKLQDGSKETIMTAAFTRAHAGGKFNDKAYKTSAGTHGVGVAAVNAVCEKMVVFSNYNDKLVRQEFSKGKIIGKKDPVGVKSIDKDFQGLLLEKTSKYGTLVFFIPDQEIVSTDAARGKQLPKKYEKAIADPTWIGNWLRNIADLYPGLSIKYSILKKGQRKDFVFLNKKGIEVIPKKIAEKNELGLMAKPLTYKSDFITLSAQWSDHTDSEKFLSFVNASPTIEHGTHMQGLRDAMFQAVKPYAPAAKKKQKGSGFSGNDLLIGLLGMFEWRMHGATYTSQIKDKLDSKVDREVYTELLPVFEAYFKKYPGVPKTLIKRALVVNKGREELAKTVKQLADVKKTQKGNTLPPSLAVAEKANPRERELFIVEGDSAAKTAIDARNSDYQEVLAAGGKPLNVLKATLPNILKHEGIQEFLIALGADMKTFNPKDEKPQISSENLRSAHIILLVDPDPDGGHIAVLYLAAIYRLLPDLLKQGRVWCVDAPLFAALKDGSIYGANTLEACVKKLPKGLSAKDVVRIKGWGEVDENWLEPLAFDPKKRRLIQINPFADAEQEKFFRGVVAEDASYRRQLLGLNDEDEKDES